MTKSPSAEAYAVADFPASGQIQEAELASLEAQARILEPGPEQRAAWRSAVAQSAENFLTDFSTRKAWFGAHSPEGQAASRVRLDLFPAQGCGIADTMERLTKAVDSSGLDAASGGHMAYIPGGGLYPSALADFLADVTNRYAGVSYAGPGAARLENDLVSWMAGVLGMPTGSAGYLASGGSMATLSAIATARDAHAISGESVGNSVVYLGGQTHHCVHKALRLVGLEHAVWRAVPLDADWRMDVEALEKMIEADRHAGLKPFLLVGSAGTTDTGVIDPLDRLADLAETHRLWYHVDAAYGGAFALVPSLHQKLKGLERADSVVVDPHKGLFLPYGLGMLLVRDVKALHRTHRYQAPYLEDANAERTAYDPADLSPELTKPFRGLRLWLPLQLFGTDPFSAALAEKAALCRWFHAAIAESGFAVGPAPDLSVCVYRFEPETGDADAFNRQLLDAVLSDGRVFLSSTRLHGELWLRMAILSFRTHRDHVSLARDLLVQHRDRLLATD